jgi:hypothetical protein
MNNITHEDVSADAMSRSKRRRLWVVAVTLIFIASASAAWWLNQNILIPNGYKKSVEQGFQILKERDWRTDEQLVEWEKYSYGEKASLVADEFSTPQDDVPNAERIRIASDSIKLAIQYKEPSIYYMAGMALQKGLLGPSNQVAADDYFKAGVEELRGRAERGEPEASLAYAYLQAGGLGGLEKDINAAKVLILNIYSELPEYVAIEVIQEAFWGLKLDELDADFILNLIDRLPKTTLPKVLHLLTFSCAKKNKTVHYPLGLQSVPILEAARYHIRQIGIQRSECILKRLEPIESHKNESVLEAIAEARDAAGIPQAASVAEPRSQANSRAPASQAKQASSDPEAQEKTGYLKGAPQLSKSGLSTFAVNNTQGSTDAIARIYLNGAMPAVRTMYIKRGESFTARTLPAGTYTLRYRFTGDKTTFEATEPFVLEQTTTDKGTRYSRVTVTLYQVENGNLQTKVVPSDRF